MKVTGQITKLHTKSGTAKSGKPWTLYSLGVDTDGSGELKWYGFGFSKPNVDEGSFVEFEAEEKNGRFDVVKDTLKLAKKTSASAKKFASGNDARQDSIVRQNACSTAAAILNGMLTTGVIEAPKTKTKKFDWYMEMLFEITNRLFLQNREPMSIEDVQELLGVDEGEDVDDDADDGPSDDDWEPF